MLVAFFADVHGNAAALESVLAAIAARQPDHIVAAGDFVGLGPSPRKVLSLIAGRSIELVRGPDDAILAVGIAREVPKAELPEWVRATRKVLDRGELDAVAASPESRWLQVYDKKLWFTHRSAAEIQALAKQDTSDEGVLAAIERAGLSDANVITFGSRLPAFVRAVGGRTIAGAGSVGYPTGGDPRPSFVLLHLEPDREVRVEIVRVPYAIARTVRAMRKSLRSGELSTSRAIEFFSAQLAAATDNVPALGAESKGTELLLGLLAPRAAAAYLSAPLDWSDASVEAIHDLHVATRRLREAIAMAAPLAERIALGRADNRCRKLARAAGERRSLDVSIQDIRVKEERAEGRVRASELLRAMKSAQKKSAKRLNRRYPREKVLAHGLDLLALAMSPQDETTTFAALAARHVEARISRAEQLLPAIEHPKDVDGQHRLRIAVKQLRYALELARPAFPEAITKERVLGPLEQVQDALGLLNDARESARFVRELGRETAGHGDRTDELVRSLEQEAKARHRGARELLRERMGAFLAEMRVAIG